MIHQHWWSVDSSILPCALGLLAVWPFRRREVAEPSDVQSSSEEADEKPEIDHLDWGIRLGMLERYERAAERFRLAVAAHPDDPAGHYNLALALDLAGHHEEARGIYKHVLEMDCDIPDAHVNLGLALLDLGDSSAAASSLKTALELAPDDATAHYDIGCVYTAQRRWSAAAAEFQASVKAEPKDAQTRFNFAIALRRSGNHAGAEPELRDFLVLARARYPEQREHVLEVLRTEYGDTGDPDAS